jgi:AcrR family transcriptional regulator
MGTKERRAAEKALRIKGIQDAAKKVFIKKGFFNSTIEEIAKEAQLSKGTIYLYFKSKDELYVSLMVPIITKLNTLLLNLENQIQKDDFDFDKKIFFHILDIYRGLLVFDPEGLRIFQVFQLENLYPEMSKSVQRRLRSLGKANYETSRNIIRKAMELGLLRNSDVVKLTDVLWAMFLGIIQVEMSKSNASKKNHLHGTLEFAFSLISKALERHS